MLGSNQLHHDDSQKPIEANGIMEHLRIEFKVNAIVNQSTRDIVEWKNLEVQILEDIEKLAKTYPIDKFKKTISWIELGREEDLLDEHSNNLTAYHFFMIEAKIELWRLSKWNPELYAERYLKYIDIVRQMYEFMVINTTIERQIDPPFFV